MTVDTIVQVLLLMLFTGVSGYFSGAETGFFSLSSSTQRIYAQSNEPRKRLIAQLLQRPRDLMVTILIMNIVANIFVQNIASSLFGGFSSWTLQVGVPLALVVIFGDVLPKSFALQSNERVANWAVPVVYGAQKVLGPIRSFITRITSGISRIMFFFLTTEPDLTPEELEHVLHSSRQQGVLHPEESELIEGFLDLRLAQVKEHMRPREEVLFYRLGSPLEELILLFVDQECSRVPVCDGDLDKLVGVITAPDFLIHRSELTDSESLLPFLQKPFFVPETILARQLLRQMDERREVLAFALDEYGSVQGLISREDLMEVVVGEIEDRRDQRSRFTEAGGGVVIASGTMELSEFEELFGVKLKSRHHMLTLGGWLTEQLGDIPVNGTNLVKDQFLFHVLAADPNRVLRVYIRRLNGNSPNGKKP